MTPDDNTLQAHDYVRAIAPYQAGKPIEELAREYGLAPSSIIKLASNENPLGMPASARAAIARAVELGRYPDGNGFDLKKALSARFGVPIEWLTLGNGSNDILELAASTVLRPGTSAIYAEHSFAVYALATQARGARAIVVPAREYGHDLDAMAAAIAPDTRLVFVANPNNPTGTFLPPNELPRSLPRCRRTCWWCSTRPTTSTCRPNFVTTPRPGSRSIRTCSISRTFSKIFGLAGLRIGFGIAQPALTRSAEPGPAAVQRERARASGGAGRAGGRGVPAAKLRGEPAGMQQLVDGFTRWACRPCQSAATSFS